MGSKTRKLRQQAGVAGERYQAEQRKLAQARLRAERLKSQAAVTSKRSGAAADSAFIHHPFLARAVKFEERKVKVRHILGSHDGADELADAIQLAAVARAQQSVHPNHEVIDAVWEGAIGELMRGLQPGELSALAQRHAPGGPIGKVYGGQVESVTVKGVEFVGAEPRREPSIRRPISRLPLLQQVLLVSTILGMGALPRDGEQ